MLPSGPCSAPITAPHFSPAGSCAQPASRRYGLGRSFTGAVVFHFGSEVYVLLNWFRAFVTVNDPSVRADTLIQYAVPLCAGGGGAPGPGSGGGGDPAGPGAGGACARV